MAIISVRKGWLGDMTLLDAIRKAAPGDEIVIEAGHHIREGDFFVMIPLTIRAERPGTVEIHGQVTIQAAVTLQGLNLRATQSNSVAVRNGGQATLVQCDLQSSVPTYALVWVTEGSRAALGGCVLHDSAAGAVLVAGGSQVMMTRTDCLGLVLPAVDVSGARSHFTARDSRISGIKSSGAWVHDDGEAVFERCDFSHCAGDQPTVSVEARGRATIRESLIHDTPGTGVYAGNHGILVLEACRFDRTGLAAVFVRGQGSSVELADTTIGYGSGSGISAVEQGAFRAIRCDLQGEPDFGIVAVENGARGALVSCTVRDGKGIGCYVIGGSQLELRDCRLSGMAKPGLYASDPGTLLTMHGTVCSAVTTNAAWIREGAQLKARTASSRGRSKGGRC